MVTWQTYLPLGATPLRTSRARSSGRTPSARTGSSPGAWASRSSRSSVRPQPGLACATDPARFREWQKGVVDGHMDGPASGSQVPAMGAYCVTPRRISSANRPSNSELVDIDPPRTWSVRGTEAPGLVARE